MKEEFVYKKKKKDEEWMENLQVQISNVNNNNYD